MIELLGTMAAAETDPARHEFWAMPSTTLTASSGSICSSSLPSTNHRTSIKALAKAWVRDEYKGIKADSQQVAAAKFGVPTDPSHRSLTSLIEV
ncbi:hypothetical protein OG944_04130 [Streptomyces anulatus]|uniref:hypothetical protein n=1 Tax=Streptomyces TaxID=1883 RepID=UPI000BFBF81F|nr:MULTISPECIES: hypothetical protein [Streptomyces]MCX4502170.1 hypothetical protein [Streptomyces anulatus]WTC75272.1 hypothetical protein OG882_35005 [Streptomyces anulatus]WUD87341.1 hypothetical protein OG703_04005 [Streptomyces anulatus]